LSFPLNNRGEVSSAKDERFGAFAAALEDELVEVGIHGDGIFAG
jgi:hypothetical protein